MAEPSSGRPAAPPTRPGTERQFARVKTEVPGPRSRELTSQERKHLAPGTQAFSQLAGIAVDHGQGSIVTDVDGNQYIDFIAGICVSSLGYGHPAQKKAMHEQIDKIIVGSFTSEPRARLVQRIAGLTPKGLTRTQLYSSGAEAVESALRLARAYTQKHEVVGFWGGFHGKTGGVLGLMGSDFKHGLGPLQPGMGVAPYAYCYRCPFKLSYPSCGVACAEFFRDWLKMETTGRVAAVIAEPIQGTAGNIVPPKEFIPAIREIARELGALYISDEMITGFGRTGTLFGCQQTETVPDVMTIGKGLGSGFPVTGVISTDDIVKAEPWSKPSFSSSSYGGNPLAAAAADATVEALVEERVPEHARALGEQMLVRLRQMQERYPMIGDVRGVGLMIGVELVKDRRSKEPLGKKACEAIFLESLRRGLLSMTYAPRVRINPPLTTPREVALEGLEILDEVLGWATENKLDQL